MTEPEFRRALRLGHGRALQFAMRCEKPMPYRQALLDTCVESQTYDPQINGHFIDFIWELICLSGERELYRTHILQALPAVKTTFTPRNVSGWLPVSRTKATRNYARQCTGTFSPAPGMGKVWLARSFA